MMKTRAGYCSIVTMVLVMLMLGLQGSFAPTAQARASGVGKLCVKAFPSANSTTKGNTTRYNREASVQAVNCNGFGLDKSFHVDGGVVCALLSAAIGHTYDRRALFIDGGCNAASLAAHHDVGSESAAACSMLSDLLAPFAKAYAVGAGVACSLGQALGMWIGSGSEHQAATGVIDHGKCLRFTTHGFPLFDDWVAVACSSRDRGFYDLPLLKPAGGGAACFGQGHFGVGLSVWLRAGVDQKTAQRIAEDYRPAPGAHLTIGSKRFSLGRVDTYINQPNFDRATRRQLIDGMGWSWKDFKATESYLHAIAGKTATIQYSSPATGPRTTKAHIDGNGECGAG